ncbi:MAG: FctA domain-containing protein, partial [Bacillota bacterium]|nr:FctA domain-containing protein [Bacillota bacterium]
MNKAFRKMLAWSLVIIMLIGMMPVDALAAIIKTDTSSSVKLSEKLPLKTGKAGIRSIIDPGTTHTHTYNFTVDGATVDTQIVKDGELLTEPAAPEKVDHIFTGWYVGENKIDFALPVAVSSTETITAAARFQKVYYVFFMDGVDVDEARVFKTKEGVTGDVVSTTDVKPPVGSTQAVTGWYLTHDLSGAPVGDSYTIGAADQQLWPKIEEGHYLYFVSGEQGTYIEPQFVPSGNPTAPTPPTRPGYTFKHWSETEGGATPYLFNAPLTADKTIYAVWTPNTNTKYTVVFWKQSVLDDKNAADSNKTYDYAESVERTATSGSTVAPQTGDTTKNYQGFHYNAAKSVAVTVKGDGTTILNVYYDRNELTIDFHSNGKPGAENGEYTGLYGQTLAQNGYTWPKSHRWTQNASSWNPGMTLTFLDTFIFDDLLVLGSSTYINVYAQNLSGTAQIIHYKEALDGTWVEANTITTSSGTFYFSNKYTGFTVYQYRADNGTWRSASPGGSAGYNTKLEVRHKRNSYKLAFYNYNAVSREETLKYETALNGFAGYVPPKPSALPSVYTFQGWYKDKATSVPFNFASETMPANDLMLYAKWAPPVVTGTFHLTLQTGGSTVTKTLTYNEAIDPSIMPTVKDHLGNVISQGDNSHIVTVPANHKWIGWATKVGSSYVTYNFNTLVLTNIELYPYYVNNEKFSVTYDKGSGTGTVPVDGKKYADGAYADVMPGSGLTPPQNMVFLGWRVNGAGPILAPNDKLLMDGNKTLVAAYGPKPAQPTLTYHPNGGTPGSPVDFTLPNNNQTVTVKAVNDPALGFTRTGYNFTGWNTKANGSGTAYQPGASIMVDTDTSGGPNVLYAQWTRNTTTIKATKQWVGGHSADHQRVTITLNRTPDAGDPPVGDPQVSPVGGTSEYFYYTWYNQYTHTPDGQLYTYTVTEAPLPSNIRQDYEVTYDMVGGSQYDWLVKNTYTNFKSGESYKYWFTTDSTKPQPIFELWRYLEGSDPSTAELFKEKPVNMGNNRVQWGDYPATGPGGVPYVYYTREKPLAGYDTYYSTTLPEGWEMAVTNYKGAQYRDVTVTKDWGSVPEYAKKPVEVKLKQNGTLYANTGEPKTLDANNNWTATWENLPNYLNETTLNVYSVEEDSLGAGYGDPVYGISAPAVDNPTTGNAKTFLKVTNSYAATGTATIQGTKTLAGRTGAFSDEFKFTLDGADTQALTFTANGTQYFSFPALSYSLADLGGANSKEFKYTVAEVKPDPAIPGMEYDGTLSREVTVTVTDNGNGTLSASVNPTSVDFTNTYKTSSVSATIQGTKTLAGRTGTFSDVFKFTLDGADTQALTFTANGTQDFSFPALSYSLADLGGENSKEFKYTVAEVKPDPAIPGMEYDGTLSREVTVTVTDNGDGTLSASVTPASVDFTNTYKAEGNLTLSGSKTFTGRASTAADVFEFKLYKDSVADANLLDTQTVTGSGTFAFDTLSYYLNLHATPALNDLGDHTYVVVETVPATNPSNGITYDETVYTVVVTVTDAGDGTLKVISTGDGTFSGSDGQYTLTGLNFTNAYKASGEFDVNAGIGVTKKLDAGGRLLKQDEFEFTLSSTDDADNATQTVKNNADGTVVFANLKY